MGQSVYENIVMVCHHFPGITPMNVWDMPYDMWLIIVSAVRQLRDKEISW